MLLILAGRNDETAEQFFEFVRARGVRCHLARAWNELSLTATCDQDGRSNVSLAVGDGRDPVTAVLNRGPIEPPTGFATAETYAAWWSALALFSGPVLNRPSRFGFCPRLDVVSLSAQLPDWVSGIALGDPGAAPSASTCVNVHRLRDRQFMGQLGDCESSLDTSEMYCFTAFDPAATEHLLVVGSRIFDLGVRSGAQVERPDIAPLLAHLRTMHADFALVVLETSSRPRVVHATPFPTVRHYGHVADHVHAALLECLGAP